MTLERALFLSLVAASAPAFGADFGTYAYDGEPVALTHGCVVVPHVDGVGFGKPDAIVLLAPKPLACDSYGSWVIPANGAHADVFREDGGGLLELHVAGGKIVRVSASGVGYGLGNDPCEGCTTEVKDGGKGITGRVKTGTPLMDGKVVIDARFDLPKPSGPAVGEKLAGGGDPGKAWAAYLAAYASGDYAALQKLMPEGEAEEEFGYHEEGAARSDAIKSSGSMEPKSVKVVEGWKIGDGALLVGEVPSPHGGDGKYKAYASLGFDGTNWRVRESRIDWGSPVE
jgi:hypothetical protein